MLLGKENVSMASYVFKSFQYSPSTSIELSHTVYSRRLLVNHQNNWLLLVIIWFISWSLSFNRWFSVGLIQLKLGFSLVADCVKGPGPYPTTPKRNDYSKEQ